MLKAFSTWRDKQGFNDSCQDEEALIAKFLAETGATEHLSNSKLFFKTFIERPDEIRCANKNDSANLRSEGVGLIKGSTKDSKTVFLENVIYAENLFANLLSLRKFVDMGLEIYLNNKLINIYDPIFCSIIRQLVYWEVYDDEDSLHFSLSHGNFGDVRI